MSKTLISSAWGCSGAHNIKSSTVKQDCLPCRRAAADVIRTWLYEAHSGYSNGERPRLLEQGQLFGKFPSGGHREAL